MTPKKDFGILQKIMVMAAVLFPLLFCFVCFWSFVHVLGWNMFVSGLFWTIMASGIILAFTKKLKVW